jgi:hypothetical protein
VPVGRRARRDLHAENTARPAAVVYHHRLTEPLREFLGQHARLLSQRFYEAFGQVATVENRAGAGGNIGTEVVVKSPPDVMNDESPALRGSTFILSFSPSTVTAPSSRSA